MLQNKASYHFHPQLVARNPLLPLHTDFNEATIEQLLQQTSFREAIYIASPELHEECEHYLQGTLKENRKKKLFGSLARYYARMNSRCTPFGMFASCSVADWGDDTKITMKERPARRTRLDMFYLCRLVQELSKKDCIRERLHYYPNNTGYVIGDEMRYMEVKYENDQRAYRISSVGNSDYLQSVLSAAAKGATMKTLTDHLMQYEVTITEAFVFIEELIKEQVLVSELEVAITGKEYIYQVLNVLERINTDGHGEINLVTAILYSVESLLKELDKKGLNRPEAYKCIIERLRQLDMPFEENKIFQADAVQGVEPGSRLNATLQCTLTEGVNFLKALQPGVSNDNLERFKKRFREKYEGREMPLAIVLDTETGIGYKPTVLEQHESPLVDGLVLPAGPAQSLPPISGNDSRWLKYLLKAQKENAHTIELTDDDISKTPGDGAGWPPSFAVGFRLAGNGKVVIDYAGGSSAVNLLGRFSYADSELAAVIKDIAGMEEKNNPDVILAEVVHLPEDRTGNVLQHPPCRSYEIPYLAKAGVKEDFRIDINDLLVSVGGDGVVLRSAALQKEIIPRLSNAHNYSFHSLPVYHFLCDLQMQGVYGGVSFSFGGLENYFNFLPRVEYKQCIIHAATWLFSNKDFSSLTEAAEEQHEIAFAAFSAQWNLPKLFMLVDGDNELLIDSSNMLMRETFIQLIKKRSSIRLKEFTGSDENVITNAQGQQYAGHFIGLVVRDEVSYQPVVDAGGSTLHELTRSFTPGSEWLYVKLYCGFKAADRILQEVVGVLSTDWLQQGLISKWFFIRYGDPQFHLRVRFLLKDVGAAGLLLQQLQESVKSFLNTHLISKVQVDTYDREIGRYGAGTMELSETIFYYDSRAVVDMIHQAGEEHIEECRWLWAMYVADSWLIDFGLTGQQRLEFVQQQREAFAKEFNSDTGFKIQLDKKYRKYRSLAEGFLRGDGSLESGHGAVKEIGIVRREALLPVVKEAVCCRLREEQSMPIESFLSSHIHMMLNRVFMANERLHEFIVYDFLSRHYQSVMARKRGQEGNTSHA